MKKQSQNKTIEAADLSEIAHTFPDGISITKSDLRDAELEWQSNFILWGINYDIVMAGGVKNKGIDIEYVVCEMMTCNDDYLEFTTKMAMKHAKKPRIPKESLASVSPALVPIVKDQLRISAWQELCKQIREKLQRLAGRKLGWTALGIGSEEELVKIVRACYGVEPSNLMRETKLLPYRMAEQLLARKNQIDLNRPPEKAKGKGKLKGKTNSATTKSKSKTPRKIVKNVTKP
jgi:hypothetical protein